MPLRKRALGAALTALVVAGATLLYPTPAVADAPPTVTVSANVVCSFPAIGHLTVYFTVSQGSGPEGRFTSIKASPLADALGGGETPPVFRVGMSVADADSIGRTETLAVTMAFDLPDGTVTVDASKTVALPLCPADVPGDADSYVQHCDRSVDAYIAYTPGYAAAPSTFTFYGRGYTGAAPYDTVAKSVTVSPGQTAHAFFPADHAYVIQIDQENQPLPFGASGYYSGMPPGCPYFPPPGSPESQTFTPPSGATPPSAGTQPGQGAAPVAGGQPGGSTTGGSGPIGGQVTPTDSAGTPVAAAGASAGTTPGVPSRQVPGRASTTAATTGTPVVAWTAAIGGPLASLLVGIVLVRRRRTQLATSPVDEPAAPDPENGEL